jgi:hypothetical protein
MEKDIVNGVALLQEDIQGELQKKRLSTQDRLVLKSLEYILKSLPPLREDVSTLKRTSIGYRSWQEPRKATVIFFLVYSFLISDLREPFFHWLVTVMKSVTSLF